MKSLGYTVENNDTDRTPHKMLDKSVGKTLDKMLLVIIVNRERNKRFFKFFSSHRIIFVSLFVF